MIRTLTDAAVRRLKPPAKGQTDIFDQGYPGLALRISYGGRKSWVYFCRERGKLKRHKLGTYPAVGLAAARGAWRSTKERLEAGQPLKPVAPVRLAVEDVVCDWLKRDQQGNASHYEVGRTMQRDVLPAWAGRLITTIGRRDVLDVLDAIVDRGRVGHARHVHAYVMRLLRWCVGRGILDRNPIEGLEKPGEKIERDRKLSDDEIRRLWFAAKVDGWPYGNIIKTLLLTAARRSEIARLQWSELDAGESLIRLGGARTKNDNPRTIPLCPLAWRIVTGGPRIQGSKLVFTTGGAVPVGNWGQAKARLDRLSGINEPWRLHDLRRTAATNLQALGVPLEVTETVLGHVSGSRSGIVGVYQQHRYEAEARAALAKWAGKVLSIVAQ
jgi:integrase